MPPNDSTTPCNNPLLPVGLTGEKYVQAVKTWYHSLTPEQQEKHHAYLLFVFLGRIRFPDGLQNTNQQ